MRRHQAVNGILWAAPAANVQVLHMRLFKWSLLESGVCVPSVGLCTVCESVHTWVRPWADQPVQTTRAVWTDEWSGVPCSDSGTRQALRIQFDRSHIHVRSNLSRKDETRPRPTTLPPRTPACVREREKPCMRPSPVWAEAGRLRLPPATLACLPEPRPRHLITCRGPV
eukprot:365668-Chlamydomonas_euryale.AAC.12